MDDLSANQELKTHQRIESVVSEESMIDRVETLKPLNQGKCSEQPLALDGIRVLQAEDAEPSNMTEGLNNILANCQSTESIVPNTETAMRNDGMRKDGPDSAMEGNSRENYINKESPEEVFLDFAATNVTEDSNTVPADSLSRECIIETNETTMRNDGVRKDRPDSVMEVEKQGNQTNEESSEKNSFVCAMEGAVLGSKESLVITTKNICITPAFKPCQGTILNSETTLNKSSVISTARNADSVIKTDFEMDVDLQQSHSDLNDAQELVAMVQERSINDKEDLFHTSMEKSVVLNEEAGAATTSDSFEKSQEECGSIVESKILIKSDVSHCSTIVPLEPNISVLEVNLLGEHRSAVVPYSDTDDSDSSSSTSSCVDSSDESSESETSSSNSDNEVKDITPVKISKSSVKQIKEKGELDIEDLPPIQDLHISVRNDEVVEIGKVLHAVDTLVVIEGIKDLPPLDIDSVLFLDRGARPLGRIFDVMGPVTEPLYCVRFNSKEHIAEQNIQSGMIVYCAPQTEHSNFVFLQHLLMMKGSDASWKKDTEAPSEFVEFSDDEEEAKRKKMQKSKKAEQSRNLDGPKPKATRVDNQSSHMPSSDKQSDHQNAHRSNRFRPRNPWGWSGATQDFRNHNGNNKFINQEQSPSRGSVRPSSFNTDFSNHQCARQYDGGQFRYHPPASQFGQGPDPRMFGQPPTTIARNGSALWCSTAGQSHPQHQNNGYPSMNPVSYASIQHEGNAYPTMNYKSSSEIHYSGANVEDQRYHAFQSEIARLVDSYNRGAQAPTAAPSAHLDRRQYVHPRFPSLPPQHSVASSAVPPPFYTRSQPIPSRLPPPPPEYHSVPTCLAPPPPPQHPDGPNFSNQNYYPGQW